MADEKSAKRKMDECKADVDKYTLSAQNDLKAGNEEDAKKLIASKQKLETNLSSLTATYEAAYVNAEKMKQLHDKLVQDIEDLENRKDAIKAKVATAKAQEHMNKMVSGVDTSSSIAAFERMEAKANKMLDTANAEVDLNAGTSSAAELADKYTSGTDATVDDELAKMKAELGL